MSHLLSDVVWEDLDMELVLANSYKDFLAKGFDYLCLHRDPGLTLKAYFFAEGMESQKFGEVVNPHDHRYHFTTQCFSGTIENQWYRTPPCWDGESIGDECGPMYNVFEWRTPLNGGNGFTHIDAIPLQQFRVSQFSAGDRYWMNSFEYHTIRVAAPETVIVLAQYEDVVPLDQPTYTFTQAAEPPDLSGLYRKFTSDQAVRRINLLRDLAEKL